MVLTKDKGNKMETNSQAEPLYYAKWNDSSELGMIGTFSELYFEWGMEFHDPYYIDIRENESFDADDDECDEYAYQIVKVWHRGALWRHDEVLDEDDDWDCLNQKWERLAWKHFAGHDFFDSLEDSFMRMAADFVCCEDFDEERFIEIVTNQGGALVDEMGDPYDEEQWDSFSGFVASSIIDYEYCPTPWRMALLEMMREASSGVTEHFDLIQRAALAEA